YEQALAGMHLADVLLVNPLADGMNLVSKEGPIVNGQDGVLVLSRAAGSFEQLGEAALPVDPLNVEETADALYRAITMPLEERRKRLRRLQAIIQQADAGWWLRAQFEDLLRVKSEGRISLRVG
ncbi:MAG: trehalose-6-phosphate synthase, partial [Chloroflexi bacterium]|nr:trehalose-6-phosphate synthase [Chloroflexota bacterium]